MLTFKLQEFAQIIALLLYFAYYIFDLITAQILRCLKSGLDLLSESISIKDVLRNFINFFLDEIEVRMIQLLNRNVVPQTTFVRLIFIKWYAIACSTITCNIGHCVPTALHTVVWLGQT